MNEPFQKMGDKAVISGAAKLLREESEVGPRALSIIIPTFNERENVAKMIRRLETCLQDIRWEAIFVDDDSSDGTLAVLRELSRRDSRVRYIQRIGRRGLASAVVEGMLSTSSPYLAVIDCDLQHDETRLPIMLKRLQSGACDIVVASRYLKQEFGNWEKRRLRLSRIGTFLAQSLLLTPLSDPMSGFFCLTREAFDGSVRGLSARGYKILLDIVMSSRDKPRIEEISYEFRPRAHGDSKLDLATLMEYGLLLLDKTIGRLIPIRFVLFAIVGGIGLLVNIAVLALLFKICRINFTVSQTIATVVAMTSNFLFNNVFTYRDQRLRGFWPVTKGLFSFYAFCALGAAANVGIASVLFERNYSWWLSAIAGTLVGVVWNYAMSSTFTWKK
jgi:dolichol-phosphate mannosyltransferase